MTTIHVSGICERDIDLLLLEELVASRAFLGWFLTQIGITSPAELLAAARSVTTSTGESDLELTVGVAGQVVKVLIENKVDAVVRPRQPERYRERGDEYLRTGACGAVLTVIVAPDDYFGDEEAALGFDYRVSHEDVLAWFRASEDLGSRGRYKCTLLQGAIDRGGRGWKLVPDKGATEFWRQYWELATALAPDLRMPRPSEKPATSNFIYFRPLSLPPGVLLVHKVWYGNVDLQFSGMGERVGELQQRYGARLGPGMRIEKAGKSAVVRALVPEIGMAVPFCASEPAVREALRAATQLLTWYLEAGK